MGKSRFIVPIVFIDEVRLLNKAEVVYEFINQFAYFACSGIIVMENYTISDADKFFDIIQAFDIFMEQYQELTKLVEEGKMSEEAADSMMKTSIKKLRSRSVVKFFEMLKTHIYPNIGESAELKKAISKISKEVRGYKETNKAFLELIETLRMEEEHI